MKRPRELDKFVGLLGTQLGCGPEDIDACAGQTYDPPPAAQPSDTTPMPRTGRWLSSTTLELQFTAPITSEGSDPDPARFGVLGFSVYAYDGYDTCYVRTRYNWLGPIATYYYSNLTSMGVDAVWIPPEDDTLLRLRISGPEACATGISGEVIGSGVLLVYAGFSTQAGARLLDAAGEPLGDIGEAWAVDLIDDCNAALYYGFCGVNYTAAGQLPRMSSLLDIPCP